ncbi:hypothetical protein PVAP13_2KG042316 [Panicum virgatum]|uniref:Uncharacterized protein n=1 Tax=Panicum virgatum TaxID=38727 RepID=A0A8T0VXU3_PANVG|nr:hypothetical protein PVAP13_2KG042316 [Panicum virgatum]
MPPPPPPSPAASSSSTGSASARSPREMSDFLIGSGFERLLNQLAQIETGGLARTRDNPPASKTAIESMLVDAVNAARGATDSHCSVCKEPPSSSSPRHARCPSTTSTTPTASCPGSRSATPARSAATRCPPTRCAQGRGPPARGRRGGGRRRPHHLEAPRRRLRGRQVRRREEAREEGAPRRVHGDGRWIQQRRPLHGDGRHHEHPAQRLRLPRPPNIIRCRSSTTQRPTGALSHGSRNRSTSWRPEDGHADAMVQR